MLLEGRSHSNSGGGVADFREIPSSASSVIQTIFQSDYLYLIKFVHNFLFMQPSPSLHDLQREIDKWITTTGVRYFNELTNMAILTEEVGEVARIIARRYGEQSEKESDKSKNLGDELADVLFVVICLANQTGVDLSAAMDHNLHKKNLRDSERHINNPKLRY